MTRRDDADSLAALLPLPAMLPMPGRFPLTALQAFGNLPAVRRNTAPLADLGPFCPEAMEGIASKNPEVSQCRASPSSTPRVG